MLSECNFVTSCQGGVKQHKQIEREMDIVTHRLSQPGGRLSEDDYCESLHMLLSNVIV